MKSVNAVELRQALGKILRSLERGGKPVLVERRGEPAAVLISLEDYRERFVDRTADEQRSEVVRRIRDMKLSGPRRKTTLDLLRELRS